MLINRSLKIFLYLLLIVLPLRESFALMIGESTPMRFGEMLMALCPVFFLVYKEDYEEAKHTTSNLLLIFLVYSFVFGIGLGEHVLPSFAVKYFIRGILFFILIRIAENKVIIITEECIELLFKYTVIIEGFFFLMQMFGVTMLFGKFGPYVASETFGFQRLSGTASEPGYLIPIITPCVYYFISDFKKYSLWAITSIAIAVLSLSSFGYVAIMVVFLVRLFLSHRYSFLKSVLVSGLGFLFALLAASVMFPQVKDAYEGISTKIIAFSSFNEEDMDYSGAERAENLIVAAEAFMEGGGKSKLLGQGVGATAFYTENNVVMYKPAEEANNLYLSVMLNQGVIGLLLLLLLFFSIFQQTNKKASSMALCIGFLTQLLQYFIVGNLWLYFFWFYIFFIIIINRQQRVEEYYVEDLIQKSK